MSEPNTIKVFYHPASALDKIQEAFVDRYFFLRKPKAVLEELQREARRQQGRACTLHSL